MRIVALLAVRNEELYLKQCLQHLYQQNIDVCLIDNDSTDQTLAIAEQFMGRGVFRIEHIPFDGVYEWERILQHKSRLAQEIDADWFIHHDADEVREAPVRFKNLHEGINFVERAGYNAINSDEFVFVPMNEEETFEETDYIHEMKEYYYFHPKDLHRVNIWKKTRQEVDLVSSGGHSAVFEGSNIFPENFILRHYIFLSKRHGVEKYSQRKYDSREVDKGMHMKRARFAEENFCFPDKDIVRRLTTDGNWDTSSPSRTHFFL
jgi:glycosyltransferase involved in cell wall biosynthesis